MGKIYWTTDVKEILDNKIDGVLRDMLANKETTDQDIVNTIRITRVLKTFCDEVIDEMEEMDRQEDEDRKGATV